MARYRSIIHLRGKVGDLSFYERDGAQYARKPGGISKERMQTDPGLYRIREHHGEFGAQSMASKSLRTGLAEFKRFWDGSFHNRLMAVGARITAMTPGPHGQRPLSLRMAAPVLMGFPFTKKRGLNSSFDALITSTPSPVRTGSRVRLDYSAEHLKRPRAAHSHYRLLHVLAVVSDMEYEPALEGFTPVAYDVDRLAATTWSDYIPADQPHVCIELETILPVEHMPDKATVVETFGVEFYLEWASGYETLVSGRAMQVVKVF